MPEYDEEIPGDMGWGPVVVRRAVYDAAMALKTTEDMPAFEHARLQAEKYREAGDAGNAAFWEDIFNFLSWRQSVKAGTETIILEDGEEWDAEKGEVIRRGARPPRSGKGN